MKNAYFILITVVTLTTSIFSIEVREKPDEGSTNEGLIKINASLAPAPEVNETTSLPQASNEQLRSSEQNTSSSSTNSSKYELDKGYFQPSPQIPFLEYNKFPVAPAFPEAKHVYNPKPVKFDRFLPPSFAPSNHNFQEAGRENHGFFPPKQDHSGLLPPKQEKTWYLPPKQETGAYLPPKQATDGYLPPKPETGGYLPPKHEDSGGYLPPKQDNRGYLPPKQDDRRGYLPPSHGGGSVSIDGAEEGGGGGRGGGATNTYIPPKLPISFPTHSWPSKINLFETPKSTEQPPYPFHDSLGPPPTLKSFSIYPHSAPVEKPRQQSPHEMAPWKKVIRFLTTLLPIGLFLTALTPTILTVTPLNTTAVNTYDNQRPSYSRAVEVDETLVDLLEGRLEDSTGCHQTRLLCQAAAKGRQSSASNLQKALWLIAKEAYEQTRGPKEFTALFKAIRTNSCREITCDAIEVKDT